MLVLNRYFYKNKKSKLCIGDRVAVLNDMFYEYEYLEYTKFRMVMYCAFMLEKTKNTSAFKLQGLAKFCTFLFHLHFR
jgi:hypothetical protein